MINSTSVTLIGFIEQDLKKMEENFRQLLNAEKMTQAYEACLKEISRRREFSQNFYERYELLEEEVNGENLTRS